MANVQKSNIYQSVWLCQIAWLAGRIPCLVSPTGEGKTAVAYMLAKGLGLPMAYSPEDDEAGNAAAFFDLPIGFWNIEDLIGLAIPSALKGDRPTTRFAPPEWLWRAIDHGCLLLMDEWDRAHPQLHAALCAGLAHSPAVIGGRRLHPDTRMIFAMNGETDTGTLELPTALAQRVFYIYLDPAENWTQYMCDTHRLHPVEAKRWETCHAQTALKWHPIDQQAGHGSYRRSTDRLLGLLYELAGFLIDGDIPDSEADAYMQRIIIGQCGAEYMQNGGYSAAKDRLFMYRNELDALDILVEPESDDTAVPPVGMAGELAKVLRNIANALIPDAFIKRLSKEDRESVGNAA